MGPHRTNSLKPSVGSASGAMRWCASSKFAVVEGEKEERRSSQFVRSFATEEGKFGGEAVLREQKTPSISESPAGPKGLKSRW